MDYLIERKERYADVVERLQALDLVAIMQNPAAPPFKNLEAVQYDIRDLLVAGMETLARVVAARQILNGMPQTEAQLYAWQQIERSIQTHATRKASELVEKES